jgi:hypothetical protein
VRLRDPVGRERHDRRRFEHAHGGRRRRNDHGQARRDDDEKACGGRQPEIEAEQDEPERHGQHEPRGERPEEADKAQAQASQRDEALHQIPDGGLYPLREEKRQARERPQDEVERALSVDSKDDDCDDEPKRQRNPENPRGANPGHFGKPGKPYEQKQKQGEYVKETLDNNRGRRLCSRRATERVQGDDPSRIAGAERKDVVEELAYE